LENIVRDRMATSKKSFKKTLTVYPLVYARKMSVDKYFNELFLYDILFFIWSERRSRKANSNKTI